MELISGFSGGLFGTAPDGNELQTLFKSHTHYLSRVTNGDVFMQTLVDLDRNRCKLKTGGEDIPDVCIYSSLILETYQKAQTLKSDTVLEFLAGCADEVDDIVTAHRLLEMEALVTVLASEEGVYITVRAQSEGCDGLGHCDAVVDYSRWHIGHVKKEIVLTCESGCEGNEEDAPATYPWLRTTVDKNREALMRSMRSKMATGSILVATMTTEWALEIGTSATHSINLSGFSQRSLLPQAADVWPSVVSFLEKHASPLFSRHQITSHSNSASDQKTSGWIPLNINVPGDILTSPSIFDLALPVLLLMMVACTGLLIANARDYFGYGNMLNGLKLWILHWVGLAMATWVLWPAISGRESEWYGALMNINFVIRVWLGVWSMLPVRPYQNSSQVISLTPMARSSGHHPDYLLPHHQTVLSSISFDTTLRVIGAALLLQKSNETYLAGTLAVQPVAIICMLVQLYTVVAGLVNIIYWTRSQAERMPNVTGSAAPYCSRSNALIAGLRDFCIVLVAFVTCVESEETSLDALLNAKRYVCLAILGYCVYACTICHPQVALDRWNARRDMPETPMLNTNVTSTPLTSSQGKRTVRNHATQFNLDDGPDFAESCTEQELCDLTRSAKPRCAVCFEDLISDGDPQPLCVPIPLEGYRTTSMSPYTRRPADGSCGHVMHEDCLVLSFRNSGRCPICKAPFSDLQRIYIG
eukprot:Clim_evm38s215 gene=Clim_evmTU38s215